jgi:2-amino-4-hydroxy-6-hydroxymethyldihydropteridine diphosphokinase
MARTVFLALGSNLGDRKTFLDRALEELRAADVAVAQVSAYHETDPVGGPPGQTKYLNAVARAETSLAALDLLATLQTIEAKLGRVRTEKDGPRTVDLDLLLVGEVGGSVIDERTPGRELVVPHPRLQDRLFVLEPLAEIAPAAVHPIFDRPASKLLQMLRDRLARLSHASSGRELLGQRVLVTGSTSGIGRAIALELAAAGADVIIHGRSTQRADEVAALCRSHGVKTDVISADLADPQEIEGVVHFGWSIGAGLDAWVHNAGADTLTGPAARWSFEEKLDQLWKVDVRGTAYATRAIGRKMKDRGQGSIVTIGWDQADTGMEGDSGQLFAAAKGAVMAFTKSLAISLAPEVRVNCIAPGWIRTAWGEHASAAWQERVRRETPLKVWGRPEDIANAARWLLAPSSRYVTGQVIRVNGGAVRG